MRRVILTCVLILVHFLGVAQVNLVPNGNFELGPDSTSAAWAIGVDSSCVSTTPVSGPSSWSVLSPSPDRLVEGDILCNWDNDTAAFGKAYVVFGAYNESGQAPLYAPLLKDSMYSLRCYLSRNTFQGSSFGIPRVCFKFTGGVDSILVPPVASTGWYLFDTTFIATANSSIIEVWGRGNNGSAVNLDTLLLYKINSAGINNRSLINYLVYPNPAADKIYITNKEEIHGLELYDTNGIRVFESLSFPQLDILLPRGLYGIYTLVLIYNNRVTRSKIQINNP